MDQRAVAARFRAIEPVHGQRKSISVFDSKLTGWAINAFPWHSP